MILPPVAACPATDATGTMAAIAVMPADKVVGAGTATPAYRWLGGEVTSTAATGVVIPCAFQPIVGIAQGCRPIGPFRRVTSSRGNVVAKLDGRPAFESFAATARPLLDDLKQVAQSIFVAIGDPEEPGAERFIVRGLLGFDADRGLIAVSEPLAEGTQLRFAVRDPYAARESLRTMLCGVKARLGDRRPRFGLYFNCAGRGRALFGVDGHDVAFISEALGTFPLAGAYVGGELGPVAGATRLLLFSGVLAVVP